MSQMARSRLIEEVSSGSGIHIVFAYRGVCSVAFSLRQDLSVLQTVECFKLQTSKRSLIYSTYRMIDEFNEFRTIVYAALMEFALCTLCCSACASKLLLNNLLVRHAIRKRHLTRCA